MGHEREAQEDYSLGDGSIDVDSDSLWGLILRR